MTDRQKPHWAEGMNGSPFTGSRFTKQMQKQVLQKAKEQAERRRIPVKAGIAASFMLMAFVAGLWFMRDGAARFPSVPQPGSTSTAPSEERKQYYDNGELLFSVYPDPYLQAGKPSGYIFSFEAPFEEFRGKTLAIMAEHKQSGLKLTAVPPAETVKPSSGYESLKRFGTNFTLPLAGTWRYIVELEGSFYGDVVLTVPEGSWEPSPLFKSGSYEMRGVEGKVGFIDAGFKAGLPQKYMWHFWGYDYELDGPFEVKAVRKGSDQIVEVYASNPLLSSNALGGPINGANRSLPIMMTLPEKGIWRLMPTVGGRALDSIVVEVK